MPETAARTRRQPRPSALGRPAGPLLIVALALLVLAPLPSDAQPTRFSLRDDGGETQILADQIQHVGGPSNLLIAVGNVEITRGTSRLLADRVELNRDTGDAVAEGKVVFFDGEDRLVGDRIDYNLTTGTGVVHNAHAFSAPYYRLSGDRMDRVGEGIYQVRRGVFTTCEGDPPAWSFKVGEATAELDNFVYGTNVSFWVGRLPLVPWFPFFAAAIRRERQSGFLFPTLGASSTKGAMARVPYYWAISDSQDLTLSLHVFTRRGIGLDAEYRYILSESARGAASGFFVQEAIRGSQGRVEAERRRTQPERDSVETGESRGYLGARHDWHITPRLGFTADLTLTSDDFVFREYGDRLHDRSRQRAESNVFLAQRWDAWSLVANLLYYQDLTTGKSIELQRLPEIKLEGLRQPVPGLAPLLYAVEASYTQFVRDLGPAGPRLDLRPRLLLPLPVAGLFTLTPFVGGRATYYNQRVVGERALGEAQLTVEETVREDVLRLQAEAGLEAETRASRVYPLDGRAGLAALQHVVEPRLTYRELRGSNQRRLPQYDPAIDAIGRVSQLEYSLVNRVNVKTVAGPDQEPARWEMVRLVLSQTYNLAPEDGRSFSDLRGDLIVQPTPAIRFRTDVAYDVQGKGIRRANTDLTASVWRVMASLGTRFDDEARINFATASVTAQVTSRLHVRAATSWDFRTGVAVENRIGADFRFQCWAILVEYVNRHGSENEIRFSLDLLGLGQVGRTGLGLR